MTLVESKNIFFLNFTLRVAEKLVYLEQFVSSGKYVALSLSTFGHPFGYTSSFPGSPESPFPDSSDPEPEFPPSSSFGSFEGSPSAPDSGNGSFPDPSDSSPAVVLIVVLLGSAVSSSSFREESAVVAVPCPEPSGSWVVVVMEPSEVVLGAVPPVVLPAVLVVLSS